MVVKLIKFNESNFNLAGKSNLINRRILPLNVFITTRNFCFASTLTTK